MKVKNQTYNKAKKRMSLYAKLSNSKFFVCSVYVLILMGPFVGFFFSEESRYFEIFLVLWITMMPVLFGSFWITRDVVWLISDGTLQIQRLILGPKRSKDPFKVVAEKLPEYLVCPKCGDPAISQKRVAWSFHDFCRECGNDNTKPLVK